MARQGMEFEEVSNCIQYPTKKTECLNTDQRTHTGKMVWSFLSDRQRYENLLKNGKMECLGQVGIVEGQWYLVPSRPSDDIAYTRGRSKCGIIWGYTCWVKLSPR